MKTWFLAAVTVLLIAAAGVAAADSTTVAVRASVASTCRFATSGSVSFSLDPATGGTVAGTVSQPTFWCTRNQGYTITDDAGMYEAGAVFRMKHALLDEYIPYTFSYTAAGNGLGKSTTITMNLSGNVLESSYVNASQGNYSDTVTLTITP